MGFPIYGKKDYLFFWDQESRVKMTESKVKTAESTVKMMESKVKLILPVSVVFVLPLSVSGLEHITRVIALFDKGPEKQLWRPPLRKSFKSMPIAMLYSKNRLAKKEALAVAAELPKLLMQTVNGGVQEVFANEKQIEVEARAVAVTVHKYIKQSNQWLSLFHNFDSALKEIGDFENWIKVMEYDCECITHALNRVVESTKSQ